MTQNPVNRRKVQTSSLTTRKLSSRGPKSPTQKAASTLLRCAGGRPGIVALVGIIGLWALYALAHSHSHLPKENHNDAAADRIKLPFMKHKEWVDQDVLEAPDEMSGLDADWTLPDAFNQVLKRSTEKMQLCTDLQPETTFKGFDESCAVPFQNDTVASLPSFGIVDQLTRFQEDPNSVLGGSDENPDDWRCDLPPETECQETQVTVVFMAYNPDRLKKTFKQIRLMLTDKDWKSLVKEVVIVWNGPRSVEESKDGKDMMQFAETNPLRVVYPLKMGLVNDLMNRYHPKVVQVQTKAILYYDDDGPFYSFAAVQGGFELWKRHSMSQIGAMARELTYGQRQRNEHDKLLAGEKSNDRQFVSHCTNVGDKVDYNFRYFANYDANMVLPSGSLLHSNYLCFLWHPALAPIREFVRKHPVNPDDVTVSTVVSHLAGRAPRVYSRRLNPANSKNDGDKQTPEKGNLRKPRRRRRLMGNTTTADNLELDYPYEGLVPAQEQRRRLMFGIDWDAGPGMNKNKQLWADLRTIAINALIRYFGSINSGSIGWCEGTEYYHDKVDGRCKPTMATSGWLPWMNADGTPKDVCP